MEAMDSWEMGLILVSFIYTSSICFPFQINFNLVGLILPLFATRKINESFHLNYDFAALQKRLRHDMI